MKSIRAAALTAACAMIGASSAWADVTRSRGDSATRAAILDFATAAPEGDNFLLVSMKDDFTQVRKP